MTAYIFLIVLLLPFVLGIVCIIDAIKWSCECKAWVNRPHDPAAFNIDSMVEWSTRFKNATLFQCEIVNGLILVRDQWGIISWRMHGENPFAKEIAK